MGFFRFILALNVFTDHLGINQIIFPSVESFFIISGFYMALILSEKYVGTKRSYQLYLSNRLLRIFPSYYVILFFIFLLRFRRHIFSFDFHSISLMSLQQNLFLFTNPDYFTHHGPFLVRYINPPAWSLGIELIFYMLAPVLIIKNSKILLLLGVMVVVGTVFSDIVIFHLFFLFILGIISYVLYTKIQHVPSLVKNKRVYGFIFLCISIFVIVLCFFPNLLVDSSLFSFQKMYYVGLTFVIPFLFSLSSKVRFDRFIGDLSYPLYISHQLALELLWNKIPNTIEHVFVAIVLETLLVFFLYKCIDLPIQRFKGERVKTFGKRSLSLLGLKETYAYVWGFTKRIGEHD